MNNPSIAELEAALQAAGNAHHEYESNFLKGERDPHWAGWYASYVLGSLGDFTTPTKLTELLLSVPDAEDWFKAASKHIQEGG